MRSLETYRQDRRVRKIFTGEELDKWKNSIEDIMESPNLKLLDCFRAGKHQLIWWMAKPDEDWCKSIIVYCKHCEYFHKVWGVSGCATRFRFPSKEWREPDWQPYGEENVDIINSCMYSWDDHLDYSDPNHPKSFEEHLEKSFVTAQKRFDEISNAKIEDIYYSKSGNTLHMSPPSKY